MADLDDMKDKAADAVDQAKDAVEGAAQDAANAVGEPTAGPSNMGRELKEAFKDATDGDDSTDPTEHLKAAGEFAKEGGEALADKAKEFGEDVGEKAKGMFEKIKDKFDGDDN